MCNTCDFAQGFSFLIFISLICHVMDLSLVIKLRHRKYGWVYGGETEYSEWA